MQKGRQLYHMLSDKELVEGCLRGDRSFQKALYDRFCKKMMVVCLRYARSVAEAEDMLQEGFVRVFLGLGGFRHQSKLETWMTRVMVNTALNHHRKKMYLYPMVDVDEIDLPDEEVSLSGLQLNQLIEMIQSLPSGCQVIFNLFAIEGYSHREIAGMLGISEGTSKSQFARARKLLQEKIQREQSKASYERKQKI
ncbi:MAG: RNA polymerase sigma factor [Cyclobacteriaceae bacterium]|nr:RNA polymerase sigma factor [Cyclobacteriaceae bacterium]